jgi:hypothetical protein
MEAKMASLEPFTLTALGDVRSTLKERTGAPRQGWKGAPEAVLEILPDYIECLEASKLDKVFGC